MASFIAELGLAVLTELFEFFSLITLSLSFYYASFHSYSSFFFSFSRLKNNVDLGLRTLSFGDSICTYSSSFSSSSYLLSSFTSTSYIFSFVVKFNFPLQIFFLVTLYSIQGLIKSLIFSIQSLSENADQSLCF